MFLLPFVRDTDLISQWGRSPGVGNGNPLQCSCLKNPVDRGTWQATVYDVIKRQTQLSTYARARTHTHTRPRDLWKLNRTVVWTLRFPLCREAVGILMGSLMAQEQLSWESMFPCWGLCMMAAKCPVWLALWLLYSYPKLPSSSYRWNTSATIWARHLHVFHKPLGLHSVLFPFWFSHWEGWRKQKGEKKRQWFPLSQRRCFRKILISVL